MIDVAQSILSLGLEDSWYSSTQLLSLIKVLQGKDDGGAFPALKEDRLKLYLEWKCHGFSIQEPAVLVPLSLLSIKNEEGESDTNSDADGIMQDFEISEI